MSEAGPRIPRIHVPMLRPTDVIAHLGKGLAHWKEDRSAHAVATSWFSANALPSRVAAVLRSCPAFVDAELVEAFLERATRLDHRTGPSQNDVLALVGAADRLAVLVVEGKVDERFGEHTVDAWLKGREGSDPRGRVARLATICALLGLDPRAEATMTLRYQLLHRTAAALIEAHRWRCPDAVMLVQSFGPHFPKGDQFPDYARHCQALGVPGPARDVLQGPLQLGGVRLWLGWVSDSLPSLPPATS